MALQEITFSFAATGRTVSIPGEWSHSGVVGSGDMEILMYQKQLGNKVEVKIVTPVKGFDHIWERVLEKFVMESGLGNVAIEINDNNATPFMVSMRLKQALAEAQGGEG